MVLERSSNQGYSEYPRLSLSIQRNAGLNEIFRASRTLMKQSMSKFDIKQLSRLKMIHPIVSISSFKIELNGLNSLSSQSLVNPRDSETLKRGVFASELKWESFYNFSSRPLVSIHCASTIYALRKY